MSNSMPPVGSHHASKLKINYNFTENSHSLTQTQNGIYLIYSMPPSGNFSLTRISSCNWDPMQSRLLTNTSM